MISYLISLAFYMQRTTQRLSSVGRSRGVAPAAAVLLLLPSSCSTPQALLAGCLSSLIISGKFTASFVFVSFRLFCLFRFLRFTVFAPCAFFFSLVFVYFVRFFMSFSRSFFFFLCLHNKTLCIFAQFRKYRCSLCCCCSSALCSSSCCCYCCSC